MIRNNDMPSQPAGVTSQWLSSLVREAHSHAARAHLIHSAMETEFGLIDSVDIVPSIEFVEEDEDEFVPYYLIVHWPRDTDNQTIKKGMEYASRIVYVTRQYHPIREVYCVAMKRFAHIAEK